MIPVRSIGLQPPESIVAQQRQARIARISELERKSQEEAQRVAEEGRKRFAESGEKAKKKREERARVKAEKARLGTGAVAGDGTGDGERDRDTSGFGLDVIADSSPSSSGKTASIESQKQSVKDSTTTTTTTTKTEQDLTNPTDPTKFSKSTQSIQSTKPTMGPAPAAGSGSGGYSSGHFHTIPSHPPIPPLSLSSSTITSLPHPLFPFPQTARHRALLKTFTDLLGLGYRVGLGPRFGGEFLIYPGDYLRYHAHFTSQVIVDDQPILPAELVAWGRLGTGTKKAGLICCTTSTSDYPGKHRGTDDEGEGGEDGDKGRVEYYSLEWANFG